MKNKRPCLIAIENNSKEMLEAMILKGANIKLKLII